MSATTSEIIFIKPIAGAAIALALGCAGTAAIADQSDANHHRPAGRASWCADRCDAVITDWNLAALQVIRAADGYRNPLTASRSLAMMHLAMHDAVNMARPRYQRYANGAEPVGAPAPVRPDAAVAAAVAAHDVMAALYPQAPASALVKAELEKTMLEAGVGAEIAAGTSVGKAAAAAVLAKRADDGSPGSETYVEGTLPGQYRFTPPFGFALMPHWRHVRPFALEDVTRLRTAPPPALTGERYTRDLEEVQRVGGKAAGSARSQDETHYAAFWYEFSDIGWNRVARAAAGRVRQDLWERARTFAVLNAAMADAYIAGWDSKFHHNSWRPVTAIQLAGQDGNPHTAPDASFETLLPTPPVPDMPSTHSALGMAAATTLAHAFGSDRVPFSFASSTAMPGNPVRSFGSFSEAARENADSRVKAGLHFRFAVEAGLQLGRQIGLHAARHMLPPQHGAAVQGD
jgi:hypothetical protein